MAPTSSTTPTSPTKRRPERSERSRRCWNGISAFNDCGAALAHASSKRSAERLLQSGNSLKPRQPERRSEIFIGQGEGYLRRHCIALLQIGPALFPLLPKLVHHGVVRALCFSAADGRMAPACARHEFDPAPTNQLLHVCGRRVEPLSDPIDHQLSARAFDAQCRNGQAKPCGRLLQGKGVLVFDVRPEARAHECILCCGRPECWIPATLIIQIGGPGSMPCRRRGADACGSAAALRREIPGQPHPDYRIAP